MNQRIVRQHIRELSLGYRAVDVARNHAYIIVHDYRMPRGYSPRVIDVRLEIPRNYPASPPGVPPSHVYLPQGLHYKGEEPRDYHPDIGPEGWAWWCFEQIAWNSCRDDLITFFELLRATLANPEKEEKCSWIARLLSG